MMLPEFLIRGMDGDSSTWKRVGFLLFICIGLCAPSRLQAASPKSTKRVPNVAVLPLSAQGVDSASAQVLTDALSDELLKSGKVRVMERSQMTEVLKEQGFQNGGACDQSECAVQMGKLLGIDKIVVGSLGRFGSTYTLSLRGVDVGTGEVVASVRKLQKGEMDAILTDLLPSVAQELAASLSGGTPVIDSSSMVAVSAPTPVLEVVAPAPPPDPVAAAPAPTPAEMVAEKRAMVVAARRPTSAVASSSAVVSAPADSTASSSVSSKGGSHWGWWVAGGAVVAGGVVAAVLLSQSGSSSSSDETVSTSSSTTTVHAGW
jgi:hypothetical protein